MGAEQTAARRRHGGRETRRRERSHKGGAGLSRPYITRNIPTYDIMGEENLQKIEAAADRILAETGILFRDDPVVIDHWKKNSRAGSARR